MSKRLDKLETLAPMVRFSTKKRKSGRDSGSETPIADFFLRKRERLDSEDLKEVSRVNQRKYSEVSWNDSQSYLKGAVNADNAQPREFFFDKDEYLDITEDCDNNENKSLTCEQDIKIEESTQMDADGFDFNTHRSKKAKATKFVIKIDKSKEKVTINKVKADASKKESEQKCKESGKANNSEKDPSVILSDKASPVLNESQRIRLKTVKVNQYWSKSTLMIPNVFRLTQALDAGSKHVIEFQDYSQKSVLATCYGQKNKSEDDKANEDEDDLSYFNEAVSFTHKRSFCQMLGSTDDMFHF